MSNTERLSTFLAQSTTVATRFVKHKMGLPDDQAAELARDLIHDICIECGPSWIYVPKDGSFELTKRDRQIFDQYNGRNLHELARKHGITHTRILQIVSKVKTEELAARQSRLPGLDA